MLLSSCSSSSKVSFEDKVLATIPSEYDLKMCRPVFSSNGNSVAYNAAQNGKEFVSFNNVRGRDFDSVSGIRISPDEKKVAYIAMGSGKQYVIVGDKEIEVSEQIIGDLVFIPNSSGLLYITNTGSGSRVSISVDLPWFSNTIFSGSAVHWAVFSPDGNLYIHSTENNGRNGFSIFGTKRDVKVFACDRMNELVFSQDGKHLAFAADKGAKSFVVFDETQGSEFDEVGNPVICPDGSKVAYRARLSGKWLVVNGLNRGDEFDAVGNPAFSSDGQSLAYKARIGNDDFIVLNNVKSLPLPKGCLVSNPALSRDGKHVAYKLSQRGNKFLVVVDQAVSPEYEWNNAYGWDDEPTVYFDSSGRKIAFGAKDRRRLLWKVIPVDKLQVDPKLATRNAEWSEARPNPSSSQGQVMKRSAIRQ